MYVCQVGEENVAITRSPVISQDTDRTGKSLSTGIIFEFQYIIMYCTYILYCM